MHPFSGPPISLSVVIARGQRHQGVRWTEAPRDGYPEAQRPLGPLPSGLGSPPLVDVRTQFWEPIRRPSSSAGALGGRNVSFREGHWAVGWLVLVCKLEGPLPSWAGEVGGTAGPSGVFRCEAQIFLGEPIMILDTKLTMALAGC